MFRLFLIALIVLAASLWIDPDWNKDTRALVLRLREGDEISQVFQERAAKLGRRMIDAATEAGVPPVASGPNDDSREEREEKAQKAPRESRSQVVPDWPNAESAVQALRDSEITNEERGALDQLINQKLSETGSNAQPGGY